MFILENRETKGVHWMFRGTLEGALKQRQNSGSCLSSFNLKLIVGVNQIWMILYYWSSKDNAMIFLLLMNVVFGNPVTVRIWDISYGNLKIYLFLCPTLQFCGFKALMGGSARGYGDGEIWSGTNRRPLSNIHTVSTLILWSTKIIQG